MAAADDDVPPHWFQDESTRVSLPPPDVFAQGHHAFTSGLGPVLHGSNGQPILLASTQEQLLQQIDEATTGLPRRPSAIEHFRRASAKANSYIRERQDGGEKATRRLAQEHATSFAQFVSAYGGIIDVVRTAGDPYALVAMQTLSVLLVVVISKSKNDAKVFTTMDEIRRSLPRLENWDRIYPTDQMRLLVATAYKQVTEFSRRAVTYLTHFRKRLAQAALPISSNGFDDIVAELHKTLAEINAEAMYGLHRRSQRIDEQVKKSGYTIEELRERAIKAEEGQHTLEAQNNVLSDRIEELLAQNERLKMEVRASRELLERRDRETEDNRMREFEAFLGIKPSHPGTNLEGTKDSLMTLFPELPFNPTLVACTGYTQMSPVNLSYCMNFKSWHDHPTSALLFLSGATAWYGRHHAGLEHCWLSPATIFITEDAITQGAKVAFFSCLPGLSPKSPTLTEALGSIILQVLSWKPDMLRTYEQDFRRVLRLSRRNDYGQSFRESPRSRSRYEDNGFDAESDDDDGWPPKALVDLLQGVLSHMQGVGPIYVVIDRLDLCCTKTLHTVMDQLARLVSVVGDETFNVKIAVVVESRTKGGNDGWQDKYLSSRDCDRTRLFVQQNWDQTKLTPQESSIRARPPIWTKGSSDSAITL